MSAAVRETSEIPGSRQLSGPLGWAFQSLPGLGWALFQGNEQVGFVDDEAAARAFCLGGLESLA